jgi:hypothetical protein
MAVALAMATLGAGAVHAKDHADICARYAGALANFDDAGPKSLKGLIDSIPPQCPQVKDDALRRYFSAYRRSGPESRAAAPVSRTSTPSIPPSRDGDPMQHIPPSHF